MNISEKVEALHECYCEADAIRNAIKPIIKDNPHKHTIFALLNKLQSLIDVEIKRLEHGE